MPSPRVASLLPSATEIVCAVGFRDALVGRSHECDFPPGVETLPVLTEPKLDAQRDSAAIDADVKRLVGEGLSIYRVDPERLRALAPDVIVTQDQCEVCAASPRDVERAVCDWTGARPRVLSLEPSGLADVWADVERVGEALGAPQRGREAADRLRERAEAVSRQSVSLAERPTLACVEWLDPLMGAGNWMPELVERAGGRLLFGEGGAHSPWLAWEALRDADPDVILVMPCGFDIARSRAELPALTRRPGWSGLRAVRDGRVYLADGNAYFNRPGPRLVESLEILAELLHPEAFRFGHEGSGWQRP